MVRNIIAFLILLTSSLFTYAQKTTPGLFISDKADKSQPNDLHKDLQAHFLAVCDEMATLSPPARQQIGRRLLHVSRTYLKRISYLAYAYQLTGKKRYLSATEDHLLAAAAFTDWNPSHFLDVAEMTMAMGIGYDWVKEDLSPRSAAIIREAIVTKGLKESLDEEKNWWINTTNNWSQVCHASMAVGAWAVEEDYPELALQLIARAKTKMRIPEAQYDPDGVYPEGTSYWEYGTSFNVLFVDAYQKAYPDSTLETSEGFKKTGEFFLHAHGPTGSFNFSDSRHNEALSAAMFWFASKANDPSLIYNQLPLLYKVINGDYNIDIEDDSDRFYAFLLIWLAELQSISNDQPAVTTWSGSGVNPVSFQRSGWDKEAIYIGNKAGSPEVSHGHMDVGSFVMDAEGVRWAIDLGMNNYNDLESVGVNLWDKSPEGDRWKVFRYSNYSHNTLVVDSLLQDLDAAAILTDVTDTKKLKSTTMDITSAYKRSLQSAIRTTSIRGNEVVVQDNIQNNSGPSTVRWAMMTYDDIEIIGNGTAKISHEGKRLLFEVVSPKNAHITIYPATPTMRGEEENKGLALIGFESRLAPNESAELIVRMSFDSAQEPSFDSAQEPPFD